MKIKDLKNFIKENNRQGKYKSTLNQIKQFYDKITSGNYSPDANLTSEQFHELATISLGNDENEFDSTLLSTLRQRLRIFTLGRILFENIYFHYTDTFVFEAAEEAEGLDFILSRTETARLLQVKCLDDLLSIIHVISRETSIAPFRAALLKCPDFERLHRALHLLDFFSKDNFPHLDLLLSHQSPFMMAIIFTDIYKILGCYRWKKALLHPHTDKLQEAIAILKGVGLNTSKTHVDDILDHPHPLKLAKAFRLLKQKKMLTADLEMTLAQHDRPYFFARELCQHNNTKVSASRDGFFHLNSKDNILPSEQQRLLKDYR